MSERWAIFIPSLQGGGAERVVINVARGLAAEGQAIDLVVGDAAGPYRDEPLGEVRLIDLGCRRLATAWWPLTRYLRRERPAVLLSALDHANVLAVWARRLAGGRPPVVISVHNSPISNRQHSHGLKRRTVMPLLIRLSYRHADGVVTVSAGVADEVAAGTGVARESIEVIYNPVDLARVRRLAEAEPEHPWLAPGQPPVILGVGRLVPQKDFATLLAAFALVRQARPARLLILGEGELRPALEALVQQLGLEDSVALPGFAANPYAPMARARLLALSSAWEGFGNVVVEALACGTPVVSTDAPHGPAEILDGGRWGRLVAVGDAAGLATAIIETLDDEPDRAALQGRAGDFSVATAAARYRAVLGALAERADRA